MYIRILINTCLNLLSGAHPDKGVACMKWTKSDCVLLQMNVIGGSGGANGRARTFLLIN